MTTNNKPLVTPKKGDEILQFYYIGKTNSGCPRIIKRQKAYNHIEIIEISNIGKKYYITNGNRIKKVRVKYNVNGNIFYKEYKNIYLNISKDLLEDYKEEANKFYVKFKQKATKMVEQQREHFNYICDQIIYMDKLIYPNK